jgi:hypothetical protein
MNKRIAAFAFAAIYGLAVVGCGDSSDGREDVSGTVKLKGQPIKDGAIVMFEPLENQGTATNVAVTGGTFTIPRATGLRPGRYLVRVTAGDGKTPVNPTNPDEPPGPGGPKGTNIISKELVPRDWNVNSKQEVAVKKGGPNKFDFDIP